VELLGPNQLTMTAALQVRSARADLLASNVANADTPGYLSRDLDFEATLSNLRDAQEVTSSSVPDLASDGASTIVGQGAADATTLRYDGNDIDANQALAQAYDNSLNYVATLKLYGDSVQRLVTATSGS
jgi:flagellar basal-body rod protein FlgB